MATLFVAIVVFAQYHVLDRSLNEVIDIERWLPPAGERHGPSVDSFAGPFSGAGLKAAARQQFEIAQALHRVPRYLVGQAESCTASHLGENWYDADSRQFSDLAISEVKVTQLTESQSEVFLKFRYLPNPKLDVNPNQDNKWVEVWTYKSGRWKNTTCSYDLVLLSDSEISTIVTAFEDMEAFSTKSLSPLRNAVLDTVRTTGWAAGCAWRVSPSSSDAERVVSLLDLPPDTYHARAVSNATKDLRMVMIDIPGHPAGGELVERRGAGYVCFSPSSIPAR